ncbi:hypothetical protein GCM10010151_31100 [Actinoallomurus spadix]|uniref:Uncharacterized protein n=1 Tax=Actinoallomurus spadix TaxID=79912 RepID=A0ABN0WIT0_9ACTN
MSHGPVPAADAGADQDDTTVISRASAATTRAAAAIGDRRRRAARPMRRRDEICTVSLLRWPATGTPHLAVSRR